jgi:GNAT superfamily N-acetyltransferase
MIRRATLADVPTLVEMGLRFHRSTPYAAHLAVDADAVEAVMQQLVTADHGAVFVAEKDGAVVGMIGGAHYIQPFTTRRIASECFWWVNPDARGCGVRLERALRAWATAEGATVLQMIAPTPDVEQLYERLGYTRVEVMYQRSL